MKMTIFNTPVISTLCHWLSRLLLRIAGWKITGRKPEIKKYVMIAAPHTSNWDFFFGLLMNLYFKNEIYWMGKKQIFRMPFGWIMKWFGGIPVDRSRSNNLVSAVIDEYKKNDSLIVALSPAGSRKNSGKWKTGFYHIATGADVPISLGYIDFKTKTVGYGRMFYPSGDMEKDMVEITGFYSDKSGIKQKKV